MNLKGFKKVHDDNDKAVLKNQHGHTITIAKKMLSAQHLKSLKSLPLHAADGAEVTDDTDEASPTPTAMTAPQAQDTATYAQNTMPDQEQPQAQQTAPMPSGMPDAGNPQQPVPQSTDQEIQKVRDEYIQQNAQRYGQESAATWHDMNSGHITPETYGDLFAKKSTLGKIGSIFGIMLSGAGSGLAHQPNLALQMMDNEIKNDLDAQKASKMNAQNLYKLYQENEQRKAQSGLIGAQTQESMAGTGLKQAQTLAQLSDAKINGDTHAKNTMLLSSLHYLQDGVNKLPNGPQKAQQQQVLGGVQNAAVQKIQQNNQQAARALADNPEGAFRQRQSTLKGMAMLGMPEAKSMMDEEADRHVPGYGDADRKVPNDVVNELAAKQDFNNAAQRYTDFSKAHQFDKARLNPVAWAKIVNQGKALAADVQNKYRGANNGGVWKKGEQSFIQSVVENDPEKWSSSLSAVPKIQQAMQSNESEAKTMAHSFGMKGFNGYSGQSSEENPGGTQQAPPQQSPQTIEKIDKKSGRTVIWDPKANKAIRWK